MRRAVVRSGGPTLSPREPSRQGDRGGAALTISAISICTMSSSSESSGSSEPFAGRLRTARAKRALSQGRLAKRAGLQPSAISHFETGTRKPSFDNLRRLADALDVTTDYLLGRTTDPRAPAGADRLHRQLDRLTADDRDIAEDFLEMLAAKARNREAESGG